MIRASRALYSFSLLVFLYVSCRIAVACVILYFASIQKDTWQIGLQPGYLAYTNIWDARWYAQIACCGYPVSLPASATKGGVAENAWAFMPLYPLLMSILSNLFGINFALAGLIINFVAGFVCTVLFFRFIAGFVNSRAKRYFACLFLNLSPVGFMFNLGYSEALYFALLIYLLVLLQERKWLKIIPFALLAALARPAAPAFALTVLISIFMLLYRRMRANVDCDFSKKEQKLAVICLVFCSFFAVLWPIVAWIATSDPLAYFKTEHVWRDGYLQSLSQLYAANFFNGSAFFSGWFLGFIFWFGPKLGAVLAILIILVFLFWVLQKGIFASMQVRAFCISYLFYILLVFFVQSSVFRILFPLFVGVIPPFAKFLPQRLSIMRRARGRHAAIATRSCNLITLVCGLAVAAGFFALGIWWFASVWYVEGTDWTPP